MTSQVIDGPHRGGQHRARRRWNSSGSRGSAAMPATRNPESRVPVARASSCDAGGVPDTVSESEDRP